ncbi:MAG: hypothetical protein KY468_21205, partial [Armatimonadetes bacterium]|nr:hypothetical protein [Armatimonadota bacterium]
MKPSLLVVLGGLAWASFMIPASPASPEAASRSPAALSGTLLQAARSVGQGRVEEAWKTFASIREAALGTPPSASDGEDLEPALLELGRLFLLWENPEAALDVWQVAAQRGSRGAPDRMAEALERKGWPVWVHAQTVQTLKLNAEALPQEPFRGAVLVEVPDAALPAGKDPLYEKRFRHSLAVYLPEEPGTGNARPGALCSSSEGAAPLPETGTLRQQFLIHYQRPEDAALARKLARNFAALHGLMGERLDSRSRFGEDGIVHVWLVSDGDAGGEQWKQHLYFYDLGRSRSHLEWMREAAHEYGHAVLPGSSGFTAPE